MTPLASIWTAEPPAWLLGVLFGLVAALYGLCGLLTLTACRRTRARASRLAASTPPALPVARRPARTTPFRKELHS